MTSILTLNRRAYMQLGDSTRRPSLDYLSAKYKNIRFALTPKINYTVTAVDRSNAPGIANEVYGSEEYWWVVCMFNGIIDPIDDFTPGLLLSLPALADINAFLSAQDSELSADVVI